MVAAGLMHHSVMRLMQNDKQAVPAMAQRAQSCLRQTSKIRGGAVHYMTTWQWLVRKQHYAKRVLPDEAAWCEKQHEQQKEDGICTTAWRNRTRKNGTATAH